MTTHIRHRDDVYQLIHDGWDIKHIIVYRNGCDSTGERLTVSRIHPHTMQQLLTQLKKRLHDRSTSESK